MCNNYRSRYVAKEIGRGPKGSLVVEFFAAVRPLSCSKFLLALACTDKFPDENGVLRKSSRTQKCLVRGGASQSNCRKSCANLKCTSVWHEKRRHVLGGGNRKSVDGIRARPRSPRNFYNKNKQLGVSVHGDDFKVLGFMPS